MTPFVSVIIATRNRQALLADTLGALRLQAWPRNCLEVIIADNGSIDGTRGVVEQATNRPDAPATRYLLVAKPGKSHAVNAALDVARGDIIAFTDDDVRPEPMWVSEIVTALERPGVDFCAGRVLPIWETAPPAWMSPALYGVLAIPESGSRRIDIVSADAGVMPIGANMAVRRTVIDRVGGLRVDLGKIEGSLRTGEDHEFFLRMLHAGYRGVYEPAAVVHHWVPAERLDRRYFREWLYQNGRDVARLETSYPLPCRRLLRVPGYLWRQAISDAYAATRGVFLRDKPGRFAAAARLRWMAGYLRESWLGALHLSPVG